MIQDGITEVIYYEKKIFVCCYITFNVNIGITYKVPYSFVCHHHHYGSFTVFVMRATREQAKTAVKKKIESKRFYV